jgi:hypothetical protein
MLADCTHYIPIFSQAILEGNHMSVSSQIARIGDIGENPSSHWYQNVCSSSMLGLTDPLAGAAGGPQVPIIMNQSVERGGGLSSNRGYKEGLCTYHMK